MITLCNTLQCNERICVGLLTYVYVGEEQELTTYLGNAIRYQTLGKKCCLEPHVWEILSNITFVECLHLGYYKSQYNYVTKRLLETI